MESVIKDESFFTKKGIIGLVLVVIFLGGLVVFGMRVFEDGMATKKAFVAERETDYVYGKADAPVLFIMYGDASCQYCRYLYPYLQGLIDTYPDTTALVYRHRPVYDKGYDKTAVTDMLVARCVGEAGGSEAYYAYIDTLYQSIEAGVRTDRIPFSIIEEAVTAAGLSLETLRQCTEDTNQIDEIFAERERLRAFGARVVPYTFIFIEEEMYEVSGGKPIEVYQDFVTWYLSE